MSRLLLILPVLAGCTLAAAPDGPQEVSVPAPGTVAYVCDAGRALSVTYGQENGEDAIFFDPDGTGEVLLLRDPSAAGLRYAWPSDGSYHVWELAGSVGTLSYRDGEKGTTEVQARNCSPA